MTTIRYVVCGALLLMGCNSKTPGSKEALPGAQVPKSIFDSTLAKELGADEYGMRKYVFAFLKVGRNRSQDPDSTARLQQAHLKNIQRLADEGKLALAGPFLDGGEIRGIYIFNVESIDEAMKLTETDPAIQAGRLTMELHPWYGSAALQKILELHKRIAKSSF
jgi:uncharacterized protein